MLDSATRRLIVRALVSGLSAGVAVLVAAGGEITNAVLYGAAAAALLAILEYSTGLNPNVGK